MEADAAATHLAKHEMYWKMLQTLTSNALCAGEPAAKTKMANDAKLAEATINLADCMRTLHAERRKHRAQLQAMQAEATRLAANQGAAPAAADDDGQSHATGTEPERFAATLVQSAVFVSGAREAGVTPGQHDALVARLEAELITLNQPQPSVRTEQLKEQVAKLSQEFAESAQRSALLAKASNTGAGFAALSKDNDAMMVLLKGRDAAAKQLQESVAADGRETVNTPRVALLEGWRDNLQRAGRTSNATLCPDLRAAYSNRQGGGPVAEWGGGKPKPRGARNMRVRKRDAATLAKQKAGQAAVDAAMRKFTPRGPVTASVHTADVGEAGRLKRMIRAYISAQQARRHFGSIVTRQGKWAGVFYQDRGDVTEDEVSARQVFVTVPANLKGPIPSTITVVLDDAMDWDVCQSMTAKSWKPAADAAQQSP
jgi:hypothetical protein